MRAMLRANSSTSAEPPLAGSDGALTVTPQFAVLAQARLAFRGRRSTLLITAARRIMGLRWGGGAVAGCAAPAKPPALTLLWSYWGTRAWFQLLELAAISPRRGEAGRRGGVAARGLEPA